MHYTDDDVDPQEVDILLAKHLNELTFQNRTRINEEIHGVGCMAPEETPKLLATALQQLSLEINNIPSSEKQAFIQNQELFPDNRYVNGRNFRLMFLRCELFDAKKAAIRLVKHLDFVLEIFDNKVELLTRPIRLEDLSPRSMKLLRTGCIQLVPVRDNSGRRIFVVTAFKTEYDVVDRLQLYAYFQTVLSEDTENQRKGVVSLAMPGEHGVNISKLPPRKDRLKLHRYILSTPVRFCAIHSCYPDTPFFRLVQATYALAMQTTDSTRFRLKVHNGTEMENRYRLLGYGIPEDQLPITSSGKVKSGNIHHWINLRATIERHRMNDGAITIGQKDTYIIECPSFNDVAVRPGKSYLCHPGNVRFKELLDKYMDEHTAANRREKDRISWGIIKEIERWNGRFLEWDNICCFWVENKDRNNIRTKIPVYFRDHKRNTRVKRKQEELLINSRSVSLALSTPMKCHEKKRKRMVDKNFDLNCECFM
eukprot:CAMPEP_0168177332 /NCGR_PEP_ID=MMETSP0139_2-20121125/8383_1 /TAXON_ID=44445 /ORGANISM="Pseudo-nitzschia australis, Strain 10249 10 AB" /LENGTH=480 /DNA_ID=CAMNT_0008096347 /DNA_START=194 /DNA_END=1636 /DNA_ORIENTATION=-